MEAVRSDGIQQKDPVLGGFSVVLKPYSPNIADNGGVKALYETYVRLPEAEKHCVPGFNFTSDQLFWVRLDFAPTLDHCVFSAGVLFLFLHNARGP